MGESVTARAVSRCNASAFAPEAVSSPAVKICGTIYFGSIWPCATAISARQGPHRHGFSKMAITASRVIRLAVRIFVCRRSLLVMAILAAGRTGFLIGMAPFAYLVRHILAETLDLPPGTGGMAGCA